MSRFENFFEKIMFFTLWYARVIFSENFSNMLNKWYPTDLWDTAAFIMSLIREEHVDY